MKKLMMPAIHLAAMQTHVPVAVIGGVRNDAAPGDTEAMLKKVSQQLDQINGETKKAAENALSEAKKAGEVSGETKATADKLLNQQTELSNAVKKMTDELEGVNQKHLDLAQKIADGLPGNKTSCVKSLGQAVMESHDKIKAFNGGTLSLTVNNAITTASGSGGGLIFHDE